MYFDPASPYIAELLEAAAQSGVLLKMRVVRCSEDEQNVPEISEVETSDREPYAAT